MAADKKGIRLTFTLPTGSILAARMGEYNKIERGVIIKQALMAYFGLDGSRPYVAPQGVSAQTVAAPQLDPQAHQVITPSVDADVLGDFGDM